MGWRDVQAGVASGRINYAQKPDKFGSFLEGFAKTYVPLMSKKQDAKLKADALKAADLKAEKTRLKLKREEQEEENALYLKQAQQIARNVGFEGDDGTINYMFNQLVTFKGDATKVETNYETAVKQNRISRNVEEFAGPVIPDIPRSDMPEMDRLVQGESAGDINATLIGEKDGKKTFFQTDKPVSEMTKKELIELTEVNGKYFNWSKLNMPPKTTAYDRGLASTPVGKYQFVGSTLRDFEGEGGLFEQLGITDDTVFDEKTQDKLFIGYAQQRLAFARSKNLDPSSGKRFERHILRKTWEFLDRKDKDGNYLTSDEDVDKLIAEIDTGTADKTIDNISNSQAFKEWAAGDKSQPFEGTEGGYQENVITLEPMKPAGFDLDFSSIETVDDADRLIATINADNTIGEAEKNAALAQVQEFMKTLDVFDFADFLDKTRIQNSGDATGAILTIQNNENIPKDAKDDYIAQLTDVMDMYNDRAVQAAREKKDPIAYYPVGEDGMIDLGGKILIKEVSKQVPKEGGAEGEMVTASVFVNALDESQVIEDVTKGFLAPEGDVATMVKVYNTPIQEASELVQDGISIIDNLLDYRKLVTENPGAMNTYLTAIGGANEEINQFSTAFASMFGKDDVSYERIETAATPIFEKLGTENDKLLFAMQLRAAYDQARLMGSTGQGLSDKELAMNLQQVGQGLSPEKALPIINRLLSSTIRTIETKRNGKIGSIIAQREITDGLRKYPYGQNFNNYAKSAFTSDISPNYDPVKSAQLYDALEGKTNLQTTSAVEPPPEGQSPDDLISAYNNGQTIIVTQALKDAYPNSQTLQNSLVGDSLKKGN